MFLPCIKYSVIKCVLNKSGSFITMLDVEVWQEVDLVGQVVAQLVGHATLVYFE